MAITTACYSSFLCAPVISHQSSRRRHNSLFCDPPIRPKVFPLLKSNPRLLPRSQSPLFSPRDRTTFKSYSLKNNNTSHVHSDDDGAMIKNHNNTSHVLSDDDGALIKNKEERFLVGITGDPEASRLCYRAIRHAFNQQAGQKRTAASMLTLHDDIPNLFRGSKLIFDYVEAAFQDHFPPGDTVIGQVGSSSPTVFYAKYPSNGYVAAAFNGNLSNYELLKAMLKERGYVCKTNSHTEVVLHLFEHISSQANSKDIFNIIQKVCEHFQGIYSMVFLTSKELVAVRGPTNPKSLLMGIRSNRAIVFAPDISTLDILEARVQTLVCAGQFVVVNRNTDHLRDGWLKETQTI